MKPTSYQFTGASVKADAEELRSSLQLRLRSVRKYY